MLTLLLLIGAAFLAFLLMAGLWLIQLRTHVAAIVDVGWALGIAIIAAGFYLFGDGSPGRKLLMVTMGTVWGLRLAGYLLFTRVLGTKGEEDGRYTQLKAEWKTNLPLKFFIFFQFQAGLDVIFAIPLLVMAVNPAPELGSLEWAGAAIWLVGVAGESIADMQLHVFKRQSHPKSQICQAGLWNYSRHPNYFFEWLVWVGFFIAALPSPGGWIALVCPVLMLFFLFKVTGIPATEAQALRSRGDAYREYQRTTSAFVPWFKRS